MQRIEHKKLFYMFMMIVLLFGVLIACSNPNDELAEPNDNENHEENNDNDSDGNRHNPLDLHVGDNDEDLVTDDESSENRLELKDKENLDDGTENESGEYANNSEEVDTSPEGLDPTEPNNTINATNTNAENDGYDTAAPPSGDSNDSTPDERPTLRTPVKSDDDPRTLTIGMYYMGSSSRNQTSFREIYTRELEWQHPNVEIEFTSVIHEPSPPLEQLSIDVTAELKKLMTGNNPADVLFLGYNDYLRLMEEDLLVALNPFIADSELSLDDFEPIVTDGLINPQDGQTYGLSPYFNASALIYNKDLFDEMNVPYPRDHMTWEEVFTLAKQMTIRSEERNVYGLAFDLHNHRVPMLSEVWRSYAHGLDVEIYDRKTEKPAVNNDQWADILINVKDLYDAEVFPSESEVAQMQIGNQFYSNTIAMGIVPYYQVRQMIDDTLTGRRSVPNCDVVSIPVHPKTLYIGAGVIMEPVLVINANGRNQLDAWRLIESIHSPEWAKMSEERLTTNLSSRKDHAINSAEIEYNKAAFYQLRPAKNHPRQSDHFGPFDSYSSLLTGGGHVYYKFLDGEMDIHEALEELEFWVNFNIERSKEFE